MQLAANVFDVWAFRRTPDGVRFLLLHTSLDKAQRYFNGGRFWQVPGDAVKEGEHITDAIARSLRSFGLKARSVWAAEHAYTIYNRRFNEMQIIGVYAAEVQESAVRLNPAEHAEYRWLSLPDCLQQIHYRGLKEGLRSVDEYVTGPEHPAAELCLYSSEDVP